MILTDNIQSFLHAAGWRNTKNTPLEADFSTRRFTRLKREKGDPRSAILMQAAHNQKTLEFILISKKLRQCGLSAPEIYAADDENGLVLMEDLGDANLGKLMDKGQAPLPFYHRATDVLVHLHKNITSSRTSFFSTAGRKKLDPGPSESIHNKAMTNFDLPHFTSAVFTAQTGLFLDFYFPHTHKRPPTEEERQSFLTAWQETLKPIACVPQTLMLRDFMPDNLMNLPNREDIRSIGILDIQDGGLGPIAYDIASLCEGVRRDTPPELLDDMVAYYHKQNPVMPLIDLRRAAHILSAQRHTRILGIITRLAKNQGRKDKLASLPRIMNYVKDLLNDKALHLVKTWHERYFDS
jgi:N-acetylmuramate 1-kinase